MFRKIIIKIKIKMAISYSYPMGTPKLTDTVLGVQYEEGRDPAVKNFSISDIVNLGGGGSGSIPTLQQVTDEGANTTVQMQINGVNVATVNNLSNFVPYTGATQSINIGVNEILTSSVSKLSGSGGVYGGELYVYDFTDEDYGYISLSESEYFLHNAGGGNIITMSENGIVFDDNLWRSSISTGTITGNRTYTLPDATGTIALSTYKVYTALLTQTGTGSSPVPTPLENTLGGTVTYSYVSDGVYNVTIPAAISISKIAAFIQTTRPDWQVTIEAQSATLLKISTSSIDAFPPTPANNRLSNTPIEIRVYN